MPPTPRSTVDAVLRRIVHLLPPRLRVCRGTVRAGLVAFRPHLGAIALGTAGLLAAAGGRRTAATVGAAGIAAVAPTVRRLADRRPGRAADGAELTVLVANVLLGRADAGALAAVISGERPDVVVLPEAGVDFRDKLVPLLDGYRGWSSIPPGVEDGLGVVALASERAGDLTVRIGRGMRVPHLEIEGGLLGHRTLYAVHTHAPMSPRSVRGWRDDLALIGHWTPTRPAPIVAGDLNAVVGHRELRNALGACRDAAEGAVTGTFPSSWPRWAGIRIDHVLVPRTSVTRRHVVLDLPGSDHRAVLTTVVLPA